MPTFDAESDSAHYAKGFIDSFIHRNDIENIRVEITITNPDK